MTIEKVLASLEASLKQFGTYSYYDKGVDEVFDARPVVNHVKTLSSKDAVEYLQKLAEHAHGEHLVSHVVSCCDNAPEQWFTEVVDGCRKVDLEVY